MTKQDVLNYIQNIEGASYDYPWENDFTDCVLRHKSSKKWFGLLFSAKGKSLLKGLDEKKYALAAPYVPLDGMTDILNLKCPPDLSVILQANFAGILPAYHMNKTHWITIILPSDAPQGEVENLINLSFEITS